MMRILVAALSGFVLALYEVSVISFLPPWAGFRPLLPLVVILIVSSTRSRALAAAMAGALVLDAYTIDHFSLTLLRLPMTVFVLDFVARRSLTNRSVYATAALAAVARLLDWAGSWLFAMAALFLGLSDGSWALPPAPGFVLLWDVVAAAAAFLLVASFTGRFVTRPDSPYVPR